MATVTTATGSVAASAKEVVIVGAAGVGLIVLLYWLAKREIKAGVGAVADGVVSTAKAVGTAVNPLDQKNIANKAVNATVQAVTMEKDATLGTKLFDWLNPEWAAYDPNKETPKEPPKGFASSVITSATKASPAGAIVSTFEAVQGWFK